MTMWKLSKLKKEILELEEILVEFEDTFSTIHLRGYYVDKYGLKLPCKVDKALQPRIYEELVTLMRDVNLFRPREEVPNRIVTTDVEGTSKLIRSKNKAKIEICYRARNKKGEIEKKAKSNNTCYISIEQRELFFKHAKETGCPVTDQFGKDHYYLTYQDYNFKYWADLMDREYARLAGIKYQKRVERVAPEHGFNWDNLYNQIKAEYGEVLKKIAGRGLLQAFVDKGLVKINQRATSIYDQEGYWLCELEEYKNRIEIIFYGIFHKLSYEDLLKAKEVLDNYTKEKEING